MQTASFPKYTIKGAASRMADVYAEYLESPWQFLAMAYLTCLGSMIGNRVSLASEIRPQPRLYTAIIGESADDRKSESIRQTTDFFRHTIERYGICDTLMHSGQSVFKMSMGVGSAEGLAKSFGGQSNLLLVYDELKAFVSKSQIDGSILLPCVNTLFDRNVFHSAVKKGSLILENAYLSMLAACTKETYGKMWTATFLDIGFVNRLFLVTGRGERRFSLPPLIPGTDKEPLERELLEVLQFMDGLPKVDGKFLMSVSLPAQMKFDDWYMNVEPGLFTKRLDTYGHRLMILLAVNRMEKAVTAGVMDDVITLLNWELEVRRILDPEGAETKLASIQSAIIKRLMTGPHTKRDLERSCHANRWGTQYWKMGVAGLLNDEQIILASDGHFQLPEQE